MFEKIVRTKKYFFSFWGFFLLVFFPRIFVVKEIWIYSFMKFFPFFSFSFLSLFLSVNSHFSLFLPLCYPLFLPPLLFHLSLSLIFFISPSLHLSSFTLLSDLFLSLPLFIFFAFSFINFSFTPLYSLLRFLFLSSFYYSIHNSDFNSYTFLLFYHFHFYKNSILSITSSQIFIF